MNLVNDILEYTKKYYPFIWKVEGPYLFISNKGFEDNKAYIYGFFTNEKYRGRGISNLFLSNIIEEIAKNNMIEEIELTVSPENIQAIKLYEKNGFVVDRLLHNEYGEGEDRYLMYKKL